jgi:L-amino acid N-acyltransferase YncA
MSSAELVIRQARPADLDTVRAIYAHYVATSAATFELTPPDRSEWDRRFSVIAEHGLPFVIASGAAGIIGYAYCTPWKTRPAYRHTAEVSVYVAPAAIGHGVGGALLDALLERAAEAGIRELIAVVADTGDPASMALHHRRGFMRAGRLTGVGFKHGRWLDTVLLQRRLPSASNDAAR